jgi:hypothetical protein
MAEEGLAYQLSHIDRRIVLGLWIIGMCIMVLNPVLAAPKLSTLSKNAIRTVEHAAAMSPNGRKICVLEGGSGGSMAPYMVNVVKTVAKLLMSNGFKVYVMPTSTDAPTSVNIAFAEASLEIRELTYGVDWMMFNYQPISAGLIDSFCADVRSIYTRDYFGNPIDSIPMMQYLNDASDIDLHVVTTGDCTWGETQLRAWSVYNFWHVTCSSSSCTPMIIVYQVADPKPGSPCGHIDGCFGAYEVDKLMNFRSGAASIIAVEQFGTMYVTILMVVGTIAHHVYRRRRID